MPSKNIVREFVEGGIYHCYNRGVEKRPIFMDALDYGVFLKRLKQMLSKPNDLEHENTNDRIKSYYGDVELLAYCLMPNHFHLLLHQTGERSIPEFMRTLSTSYTMYFNKRYKRVGHLFQGTYKARHVDNEAYWLHISRYIHLNPLSLKSNFETFPYSSMHYYKVADPPGWVRPDRVLGSFGTYAEYLAFVEDYITTEKIAEINIDCSLE
jgi:putative transposase